MQNYNNYNIQPPNFQKTFLEEKFLEGGEIKEGVEYYMSAFLIYSAHAKPSSRKSIFLKNWREK